MVATDEHVVVVGAGITGASIAFHLADRGVRVTVVEQGLPASGATGSSFAWIGRPVMSRLPSAALRQIALDDHHRLQEALPGFPVTWPGSLVWDQDDPDELGAVATVDDLAAREPMLRLPTRSARYRPEDGSVDPVAATERLLDEARQRGAEVRLGTTVTGIDVDAGTVRGVRTLDGTVAATRVVLACGVGSVALCRQVGFDLHVDASPTVLVRLDGPPGLVRHALMGPDLEVRQLADGRLLSPVAFTGERDQADLAATAATTERRINALVVGDATVHARSAEIGWRPMPRDGEPLIGPVPGLPSVVVAVMHSAVTLAPAVGRLVADEIVDGQPAPELSGCRLTRSVPVRPGASRPSSPAA